MPAGWSSPCPISRTVPCSTNRSTGPTHPRPRPSSTTRTLRRTKSATTPTYPEPAGIVRDVTVVPGPDLRQFRHGLSPASQVRGVGGSEVAAGLDDAEAGGDVGTIGVRRVGGGVGARAMEVGVRRGLVDEDPTEEVLAQRDARVERGVPHLLEDRVGR